MRLLLAALACQLLGGLAAVVARRSRPWSTAFGVGGALLGAVLGLVPAVGVLFGEPAQAIRLPWDVPFGSFTVELDPLSAFFLLPLFGLSAVAAVYGGAYLLEHEERQSPGTSWFFFDLLMASMALVIVARNAVLFLVAWEVMALASFFLVTAHDDDATVREAGWTYLVATHLGTACLLVMFVVLGNGVDPLDFDRFSGTANAPLVFLLAIVGFGTKAGFVPFHVWLPDAHPAAPSHVSAIMSGVMIKTGVYGLLRVLTLVGPLPPWCGWLLVAVGASSGVLGILLALAQEDLKRVLAYSSIEHIGIITLALGLGLVGLQAGMTRIAILGFAAALFHVVNHTVLKGLLFLGAGIVARRTGTRCIDALGGLLRRLPRTGVAFLVGSAAAAGLPPLNGFASEFLLYLAAYSATTALTGSGVLSGVVTVAALALIGGFAAASSARVFGIVFLGEPRSEHVCRGGEPGAAMQGSVLLLAACCVLMGTFSPILLPRLAPVLAQITALPHASVAAGLSFAVGALWAVVLSSLAFAVLAGALAGLRLWLLAGRHVAQAPTWDCGYAAPSARMQYTASSFSQPLMTVFTAILGTERHDAPPMGFFPSKASFASRSPDPARARLYDPAFRVIGRGLASFRWLQHGRVHLYVLYIALTLIALLLWKIVP